MAPAGALLRHPSNQRADFRDHTATRRSVLGVGPFPGDELPVPSQRRVRRDNRRDLTQGLTAQPVASHGQRRRSSSVSRRRRPPTRLLPWRLRRRGALRALTLSLSAAFRLRWRDKLGHALL